MSGLVERLTNMVAFLKHHGEFPGGQDLLDEAAARITALEAENERLRAFEARVLAAVSFAEPTDKTAQVEAAAVDLRGGLSLRKCAAKHGLTFSQVRTIARQALGGPHDAD